MNFDSERIDKKLFKKMVLYFRIAGTLAAMSMVGSGIIIISYLTVPALRKHPINLVFFLAIADFFFSLKWLITSVWTGNNENKQYKNKFI